MTAQGLMRAALWTEIREALLRDFPNMNVPIEAPDNIRKVICDNADWMFTLSRGQRFDVVVDESNNTEENLKRGQLNVTVHEHGTGVITWAERVSDAADEAGRDLTLEELLHLAKSHVMTPAEIEAQRESFARQDKD